MSGRWRVSLLPPLALGSDTGSGAWSRVSLIVQDFFYFHLWVPIFHTHARFAPSCDSFFPPEPSSGGASLSLFPPLYRLLFFSLSSPSSAWCAPLSFLAPLHFYLFIFIWLLLPRSLSPLSSLPPSLWIPALSPEWRVGGSAAGQA